jgi:hypothetical protein
MTGRPLLLLALVPAGSAVAGQVAHHRRIACAQGLVAIALDAPEEPGQDPEAAALGLAVLQATILSAYAEAGDVLPVALGAAFSDEGALTAHLAAQADRIAAERRALAGAAEYVLAIDRRAPSAQAVHPPAPPGYLRRRQAERNGRRTLEEDRRAFAERALAALGSAGGELAPVRTPAPPALLTVSALLPRPAVANVSGLLAGMASEAAALGLAMRMIGPCAPFSFVSPARPHA